MSDELICPKCGMPLVSKRTEWQVDEDRAKDVIWHECPRCGWATWEDA
jgi:hypothetical protein